MSKVGMTQVGILFALATMMFGLAARLAMAAGPTAASRMFSADFYLDGCKDYVAGKSNFFGGRCAGAVEVLSALNLDTKLFCPPDNADTLQRVRIIVSYIEARPERKTEDFRLLANEAMAKAWPCKH
jgi:hypothetical protein